MVYRLLQEYKGLNIINKDVNKWFMITFAASLLYITDVGIYAFLLFTWKVLPALLVYFALFTVITHVLKTKIEKMIKIIHKMITNKDILR